MGNPERQASLEELLLVHEVCGSRKGVSARDHISQQATRMISFTSYHHPHRHMKMQNGHTNTSFSTQTRCAYSHTHTHTYIHTPMQTYIPSTDERPGPLQRCTAPPDTSATPMWEQPLAARNNTNTNTNTNGSSNRRLSPTAAPRFLDPQGPPHMCVHVCMHKVHASWRHGRGTTRKVYM